MLTPLDISPILIFTILGIWGFVFLIKNYFSRDPYYGVRNFRFYKRAAPGMFLVFTIFYLIADLAFVVGPVIAMFAVAKR